jgi:hypothetical protein
MKALLTVVAMIGLVATSNARAEGGGPSFEGVKLKGTAYSPLGGDFTRIGFRLRVRFDDQIGGGGLFDCRAISQWANTCPAPHAVVSLNFGRADVIGDVSTMTIHAALPDGGSCDFDGVTPLPVGTPGTPFHIATPIVSVAGTYSCTDANGAPTKSGNFVAQGSPLRLSSCRTGQTDPICIPPF